MVLKHFKLISTVFTIIAILLVCIGVHFYSFFEQIYAWYLIVVLLMYMAQVNIKMNVKWLNYTLYFSYLITFFVNIYLLFLLWFMTGYSGGNEFLTYILFGTNLLFIIFTSYHFLKLESNT